MRFKFRLEKLLNLRLGEKEAAFRDFAEAQRILLEIQDEINSYSQEIKDARVERLKSEQIGDAHFLQYYEQFIAGGKIKIKQAQERLRQQASVVEGRREVLMEANRELQKLERFKDKKRQEYLKEVKKIEAREVDDLNIMRGRRFRE